MSAKTKTFGLRKDGTLGQCKAKPENQGKGNCPHEKHVELSIEELKTNIIQRFNEEALEKHYSKKSSSLRKSSFPDDVTSERIQSHSDGIVLSKEELERGSLKVAEKFKDADWSFIKKFYEKYDRMMNDEESSKSFEENPADSMTEYLESDDPVAERLRGFLGDEINIREFSEIIVQQVGAMSSVKRWSPKGRNSIKRCILSALNNDMTKERYIASVVFFGGRCCYCNKTLRKNPPPDRQASGEHITPINPENRNAVPGGTRYGNMALACLGCNSDRGNKELVEWISETDCIKKENKEKALGRIKAFREFALYSEYSKEKSLQIDKKVNEIKKYIDSQRDSTGSIKNSKTIGSVVPDKIKVAIFDLQYEK